MAKKLLIHLILALTLVFSVYGADINIINSSVSITGNHSQVDAQSSFMVKNQGNNTLTNTIFNSTALTGTGKLIPVSAITLSPSSATLNANTNTTVAVVVSIPSYQKPGTYTGTLNAVYNSTEKDNIPFSLTVNPGYSYSASAQSLTVTQGKIGTQNITIKNTGNSNAAVSYKLSKPFYNGANQIPFSESTTGSTTVAYVNETIKGEKNISLTFAVPISTPVGTYTGQANLTCTTCSTQNITVPLSVIVTAANYAISMSDVNYSTSSNNANVSKQVTITNTGDYTLNNVELTTDASNTQITGTTPPTSLAKGASFTITLNTTISKTANSGTVKIGNLYFKSNELNKTTSIYTNVQSMLEIKDVKISLGGGSYDNVDNGETVSDEAKPNDELEMKVSVKNNFDDSGDENSYDSEVMTLKFKR